MTNRFSLISSVFVAAASVVLWPSTFSFASTPENLARVRARESARISLIKKLTPSVVCIFGKDNHAGGGSGVVIDSDGYGLTNYHVVAGMLDERAGDGGLFDGKTYDLEVLGIDPTGDVAMFRIAEGAPYSPPALGNSDDLVIGQETIALGNPFLLAEDYTPTATFGIISGLHRYQYGSGGALVYTDCIQVDASINPGNSGGPLFDLDGRLIGINGRVSIEERGRVNVGVGYAISINQIKRFIPALRAGLVVRHGSAGFTVFDSRGSVIIDKMLDDSRAYLAGLRLKDAIVKFDGREVRTANQFLSILGTYPADWPVEVVYKRNGTISKVSFRLDALPLPKTSNRPLPPGVKAPDPFAETPKTIAANQSAVERLLKLAVQAVGGTDAMTQAKTLNFSGTRSDATKPLDEPEKIDRTENTIAPASAPAGLDEVALRWALWSGKLNPKDCRLIRPDNVSSRIGAVIEYKPDADNSCQYTIDDQDGRLLAIDFSEPGGKNYRVEFDDHKRADVLRLPYHKRILVNGKLVADEKYSEISVAGH